MIRASRTRLFPAALLAAALPACGPPSPPEGTTLLLTDVLVLDVRAGAFGEPTDVAIGGDRILRIGRVAPPDPELARIDGEGAFLLPALHDGHVHLSFLRTLGDSALADTLRAFVRQGVLHVQDMGGPLDVIGEMSRRVASGEIVGPRISFSGPMAEKPPLQWARYNEVLPDFTVPMETAADVERLVTSVADAGGSHLKAFGKWDLSLFRRLLDLGRERGLEVVLDPGAPLFQDVPVDTALALGVRRMEHGFAAWQSVLRADLRERLDSLAAEGDRSAWPAFATEVFTSGAASVDSARLGRVAEAWATSGTYFCPTLNVLDAWRREPPPLPFSSDEEDVRPYWTGMADGADLLTSTLAGAGVRLLVGQDGMASTGAVVEMGNLVRVGLSAADAIRAATWNAAEWAGELDDHGSVDVGKRADLVLVREDPLEDVGRLTDPWAVVQGGVVRVRDGVPVGSP
ncbi:MAG TPA: amidohydrolase family protein [Longimicrobiales bacterium]|nr:amidohydrolase family protein [Longimicrobiales bacterium]